MLTARRLPRPARALLVAAALGASVLAVHTSPTASYAVRALTAIAAAAVLLVQARHDDQLRRSRRLVAVGLLAGSASGVASTVYTLVVGHALPLGNPFGVLELSYAPFAAAGLLALPNRRVGGRLGPLADGAAAAGALWFIALQVIGSALEHAGAVDYAVTTGYVLVGTFTLGTLVSVYPQVDEGARPFLQRIGLGLACVLASDAWFAVASTHGGYDPTGPIAQLYQVGLGLVLVAAGTPARDVAPRQGEAARRAHLLHEVVLPYAPLAVAVVIGAMRYAEGLSYTRADMLPILTIGTAMVARHAASSRDHRVLVTALEASEQAARAETLVDPLTGLANRRGLLDFLERSLVDVGSHPVGVAMVDLNDFKDVNDTHGHETGDLLLRECARRLLDVVPPGGVVARLGGDEFAVCQPRVVDGGHPLAATVAAAFDEPILVGRRPFTVRPSVGVVLDERTPGTARAKDSHHLLAHADVAMYQAKADKDLRQAPAVVLTGSARRRAAAMIRLREEISAPDLGQFHVLYQPVVDLRTGQVRGVEALLRWRHPDLGEVSPAQFVPMAEQVGSMPRLGEHVLEQTAAQLARWAELAPDVRLAAGVNLSPRELGDPALADRVLETWARHGLVTDQLVLEITEGALMEDLELAAAFVTTLRGHGVSVAIDDYGTGYSSLRYLRRFDADVLKIDREFVGSLVADGRTEALVRSVVELAAALDLQTIAEGIETVEQLRACQALGCELAQGYLFSRPVPADEITALLLQGTGFDLERPGELVPVAVP
ncbi:bifunctional diguanylate cyclase/phosphodiesterase [Angustibacter peucedani]